MNAPYTNDADKIPPGATLRRLKSGDITALIALERECFATAWREDQFLFALQQKAFCALGLFLKNADLAGYISAYHLTDELEILNIAVNRKQRRQGFGLRLLSEAMQLGRALGLTRAVLEVRAGNAAAIAMYERTGFSLAGKRPGYYEDTGEDALVYAALL